MGRCNRSGEFTDSKVFWWDIPDSEKESDLLPYDREEISRSRTQLNALEGMMVSPASLPEVKMAIGKYSTIRSKDIIELFDTTLDLSGHSTDVSRFIRVSNDTDVQVFWRDISDDIPTSDIEARREELCPVPIGDVKELLRKEKFWTWDPLDSRWSRAMEDDIRPGVIVLMDPSSGHYSTTEGWNLKIRGGVPVILAPENDRTKAKGYDEDPLAETDWKIISAHTDDVCSLCNELIRKVELDGTYASGLASAARWHDCGKAHPAFQARLNKEALLKAQERFGPASVFAKAPSAAWLTHNYREDPPQTFPS